jgi:hypothetical protein
LKVDALLLLKPSQLLAEMVKFCVRCYQEELSTKDGVEGERGFENGFKKKAKKRNGKWCIEE